MTQDEYRLYTGQEPPVMLESDWETLLGVAEMRLASFLCLEALPDPLPDDLKIVLANFLAATFRFQGGGGEEVASKSVRNFSISFQTDTASNAWVQIQSQYGDILDKYSACGGRIDVEGSRRPCCGC